MVVSSSAGPKTLSAVGCLAFWSSAQSEIEKKYIYPNQEFDIGRETVQDLLNIRDCSISKHHLRIHCVVYEDDGDAQRVAPMVWARVLSSNAVKYQRSGLDEQNGGILLKSRHGAVLLNPGDTLHLTHNIRVEFKGIEGLDFQTPGLDSIRRIEVGAFRHEFRLSERVLGVGGYAVVYVANEQSTNQLYACKIVSKPENPPEIGYFGCRVSSHDKDLQKRKDVTTREVNVLRKLSHPNIICLKKVYATPYNLYILQELITGGDLLSYLDMKGPQTEPQSAVILRQLLEAVQYLHSNNVVHRDIKPENILMTSWRDGCRIVLTDFGQSRTLEGCETAYRCAGIFRMHSSVGTVGYVAPEVYRAGKKKLQGEVGYSEAVDMWSVGCVAVIVMTNESILPDGKTCNSSGLATWQNAQHSEAPQGRAWSHIGHRAQNFIRGCLTMDENTRLTARQALQLSWFTHPHYCVEFDAAYERAVADWKPRSQGEQLIVELDTTEAVKEALGTTSGGDGGECCSKHFRVSPDHRQPPGRTSSQSQHEPPPCSMPVQRAPTNDEHEYGEDAFVHLSQTEVRNLEWRPQGDADAIDFSLASVPFPPPSSQRQQMYRGDV